MLGRVAGLVALTLSVAACAHSPDTIVHFSAPEGASWEVRDGTEAFLCALPCSVELDEHQVVSVVRSDGRTRFVVHQQELGEGTFSGSVRTRPERTRGALAARVFAAALSGAGSALAQSDDRDHVAAGVFLSGVGAAARAAIDAARREREELWVQRSATP